MSPPIEKDVPLDLRGVRLVTARGMRRGIVRCCHQLETRRDNDQSALDRVKTEYEDLQQQLASSHGLVDDDQAFEFTCLLSNQQHRMDELKHQMCATQDDLQDCDMKKEQLDLYIQAIVRQQAVYEHMHMMYNPRHHTRHYLLMAMWEFNQHCMLEIQQAMSQLYLQYEQREQIMQKLHFQAIYELHRHDLLELEKAIEHRLLSFE
jgi:hypothetical protein